MEVTLPEEMASFVREQVEYEGYKSPTDVVREGLRLLQARHETWAEDVRKKIAEAEESFARGDFYTPEQVKERMAKMKTQWRKEQGLE